MKPKKLLTFAAGAAAACIAASAHAQTITSVQFAQHPYIGTDLTSSQVAGEGSYAVDNWNVVDPLGANGIVYLSGATETESGSSGLIESDGVTNSGITYNLTSGGPAGSGNGFTSGSGDNILLKAGAATAGEGNASGWYGAAVTLTLSGLLPGDTYSFVAYISGADYELGEASVSDSALGVTDYIASTNGGYSNPTQTSYVSNPSTTDFSTADANSPGTAAGFASNYVTFTGITGTTSETISLNGLGAWPNGTFIPQSGANGLIWELSGVQVIATPAAVPEPGTVWGVVLGLLALAFLKVRRRSIFQA